MKIVMLPLDERPCNYYYPAIMPHGGIDLVLPPQEILGDKKKAGDFERIVLWLKRNTANANGLILSVDMLLYGGIVPSRLHQLSTDEIYRRIGVIEELKRANPKLTIYAFQLLMRCPWYSSADEEPDYYEHYGREIHQLGRLRHLKMLEQLTEDEGKELARLEGVIPPSDLADYLDRRVKNTDALLYALGLLQSGTIDYFAVPQDDSAPHGFTALDQIKVRKHIKDNSLHLKASMYPGADETGLTLLARFIAKFKGVKPRFYVHYASSTGATVIPSFEDRMADETIKYQIMAAGGVRVYSLTEADILLAVNIGGDMAGITDEKNQRDYDINRNIAEFVEFIRYALSLNKAVAVADTAYANGGDIELVKLMQSEGLLYSVNAYAGWNTSSNTLGTAICQGVASVYAPDSKANELFLTHRYLEDVCYCAYVRKKVIDEFLPALGLNYFDAGEKSGRVADIVKEQILDFCRQNLNDVFGRVKNLKVSQPWARMFETFIKAE